MIDYKFPELKFKGQWRRYQQRVLDEADMYLADKKIHIVAAPGSGKTTLGIELIRRIGQSCLILSPSIVIREQWLGRIREAFLTRGEDAEGCLSNDIQRPAVITAVTYQALHSAMTRYKGSIGEEGYEEIVDFSSFSLLNTLRDFGFGTLCLDECHHLRSEWWNSLETFRQEFGEMMLIALTATPPYDSTPAQWERYTALCGEIDEEIHTPELVKENSLCPHQDYVLFNYPTRTEHQAVTLFRKQARDWVTRLVDDDEFVAAVAAHPGLCDVEGYSEKFLETPAYLSSMLILLNQRQIPYPRRLLKLLGAKRLPRMDVEWMEALLQGFLFDDRESFSGLADYQDALITALKAEELIVRGKVGLRSNAKINRMLTASRGKRSSVCTIVEHELKDMGDSLRLLILTDYIKKEYLSAIGNQEKSLDALGVIPFFETLRRKAYPGQRLGVLCGSVVIVPMGCVSLLPSTMDYEPLTAADGTRLPYVILTTKGDKGARTAVVTQLFQAGHINVLIGTKALLGEGWDSPAVNSLILASFVGSFMLSNQMRGRAIRALKDHPGKTGNIWHLVCVEKPSEADNIDGSEDYRTLVRRMDHFLGLHYTKDQIETGVSRLSIIEQPFTFFRIHEINRGMLALSKEREQLRARWQNALVILEDSEVVDELSIKKEKFQLSVLFFNILGLFLVSLISTIFFGHSARVLALSFTAAYSSIPILLLALCLLGFCAYIMVRLGLKLLNLLTPWKKTERLAQAVLKALQQKGLIQPYHVTVHAEEIYELFQGFYLQGGSTREKSLFATCLHELFKPVENQRYILMAERFANYSDYYNVPDIFSKNKNDAQLFQREVNRAVGPHTLVYTRTPEGRRSLLKARARAIANRSERIMDRRKAVSSNKSALR